MPKFYNELVRLDCCNCGKHMGWLDLLELEPLVFCFECVEWPEDFPVGETVIVKLKHA